MQLRNGNRWKFNEMLHENWDYSKRGFSEFFVKINCNHIKTREVHIHSHASWGSVQRPLQSPVSTKSRSCYMWTCVSWLPKCQVFGLVSSVTLLWVSMCHLTGWLLKNIVFWKLPSELIGCSSHPPSVSLCEANLHSTRPCSSTMCGSCWKR
jgi:hypothetical protein